MILCRTLGPVEVTIDGAAAPNELLWRKNLALLVYLARSPKRARARAHLLGLLWADKPEHDARRSLNVALSTVRLCAGGGVETKGDQVRLRPGAVQLDTEEFERLTTVKDWRGACTLVAGEFLEGFAVPGASEFESWLAAERAAWRGRSVDALTRCADALLAEGYSTEAADLAHRAFVLDPTADGAVRTAMRCLTVGGDRTGALQLYDGFVARLASEVGSQPEAETRVLAERVRRERVWRLPREGEEPAPDARRPPLVGRARELERLRPAWGKGRRGPRAAVGFIEGDAGVGKTRLAEEVLARARLDGAAVAVVRTVEGDLSDAWSGLLGLARGGLLEGPGLAAASAGALAALAERLPEWAERFAGAIRGATREPIGRAFSEILRAVTGEQPVVLLVDGAQWLDRDSLLALGAVLRDLRRAPLYCVFTVSPAEPRAELDELRARIGRDLAGAGVRLEPLGAQALRELARWALPRYRDSDLDRLTRRISVDSAGLPLLAVELLHAVSLGLDLGRVGGGAAWPAPLKTLAHTLPGDLPEAVVGAIRVGYRRLPVGAQNALKAAAVLGDRVPAHLIGKAAGLAGPELAAALDALEWHRWLAAEPRGYAFVARIVRDVLARDMITPGQRQRMLEAAQLPPA